MVIFFELGRVFMIGVGCVFMSTAGLFEWVFELRELYILSADKVKESYIHILQEKNQNEDAKMCKKKNQNKKIGLFDSQSNYSNSFYRTRIPIVYFRSWKKKYSIVCSDCRRYKHYPCHTIAHIHVCSLLSTK